MTRAEWHRFWFPEVDPFVIGVYRIALGLFQLLYYVALTPSWLMYYGPASIPGFSVHPPVWAAPSLSLLRYVPSERLMWAYYALSVCCALCLIAGVGRTWPVVWLWFSNFSVYYRSMAVGNGEEQIMGLLLFFSLFLPLNAACTLPGLLRRIRHPGEASSTPVRIHGWSLMLIQTHFALVYLISVPFKLAADPAWRDGTLVYYATMSLTWVRLPECDLFAWGHAWLSRAATLYTLAIETFFPLFVWCERFRLLLVLGVAGLHLVLAFFLRGLAMFNIAMLVGVILFLPSRRTRRWFESLGRRVVGTGRVHA